MATLLLNSLCLASLLATAAATTVSLDRNFTECGGVFNVESTTEFVVRGRGNGVSSCNVTLEAGSNDGCLGLCYTIRNATFEMGNKITGVNSLSIAAGADIRTFKHTNPYLGTVCTSAPSMTLTVTGDTKGTEESLTFDLEVEIYNNCGASNKSITFEEVVAIIEGFDHGEQFKARESMNFYRGLAMGLGLAGIWLVVMLALVIYLKCCPRRAPHTPVIPSVVAVEEKMPLTKSEDDMNIEMASVQRPTELKLN